MILSLPFSPPDATPIGDHYAMQTHDGLTYYFINLEPFDCHPPTTAAPCCSAPPSCTSSPVSAKPTS